MPATDAWTKCRYACTALEQAAVILAADTMRHSGGAAGQSGTRDLRCAACPCVWPGPRPHQRLQVSRSCWPSIPRPGGGPRASGPLFILFLAKRLDSSSSWRSSLRDGPEFGNVDARHQKRVIPASVSAKPPLTLAHQGPVRAPASWLMSSRPPATMLPESITPTRGSQMAPFIVRYTCVTTGSARAGALQRVRGQYISDLGNPGLAGALLCRLLSPRSSGDGGPPGKKWLISDGLGANRLSSTVGSARFPLSDGEYICRELLERRIPFGAETGRPLVQFQPAG